MLAIDVACRLLGLGTYDMQRCMGGKNSNNIPVEYKHTVEPISKYHSEV